MHAGAPGKAVVYGMHGGIKPCGEGRVRVDGRL